MVPLLDTLTDCFTDCFLYMPRPGIEPTTLDDRDDALTNGATRPGPGSALCSAHPRGGKPTLQSIPHPPAQTDRGPCRGEGRGSAGGGHAAVGGTGGERTPRDGKWKNTAGAEVWAHLCAQSLCVYTDLARDAHGHACTIQAVSAPWGEGGGGGFPAGPRPSLLSLTAVRCWRALEAAGRGSGAGDRAEPHLGARSL